MLNLSHQYLLKEINEKVKSTRYGNMTITVILKDGEPIIKSLNIVIMKRKRYKMPTA